ncbi:MAG: phytanoyl-CoA dioxygenase family protein [Myxococcota bacterium]
MTQPATVREGLTPEERENYQEQGYVVARRLFTADELHRWRDRFRAIVRGEAETAKHMLVMRDVMVAKGVVQPDSREKAIAKIQDFHHDSVLYGEYVNHERMLERVEALIGPDIKSIHTMLINKPPGLDGRHPIHQDLLYFPFRPADLIVAVWTAIDPCTRENGCLVVVPGSHKGELIPHELPDWKYVNGGYFGIKGGKPSGRVHLEMDPGDTVFFHPLLLHGSGVNRTQEFRRSISCHFASASCRYLDDGFTHGGRPYLLVRGREHEGGI